VEGNVDHRIGFLVANIAGKHRQNGILLGDLVEHEFAASCILGRRTGQPRHRKGFAIVREQLRLMLVLLEGLRALSGISRLTDFGDVPLTMVMTLLERSAG
jgi:hypothetical protein